MKGISFDEKSGLRIGSLTTLAEIERSEIVEENVRAAHGTRSDVMASAQVRNLATIGGNLCSAVPSADTAPPLIALGASVQVSWDRKASRTVPIEEFFTGPKACACGDGRDSDGRIGAQARAPFGGLLPEADAQKRHGPRLVGVAACLTVDAIEASARGRGLPLAAVAPTPIRAPEVEERLVGKAIDEAVAAEAATIAGAQCRPITDLRASLEYRCGMVEVLTKRAVMEAKRRITG